MNDDPKDPLDLNDEGDEGDDSQNVAPFPLDVDDVPPDVIARFRRPERPEAPPVAPVEPERPRRAKRASSPEDRFPMLPQDVPPTAPLKEPPQRRPPTKPAKPRGSDLGRNLIALFFVLASCGVIAYIALIWQNPYSTLNPLAPPTPLPLIITATYTPSATYTASPTSTPAPTRTPTAIPTLAPTLTFTPIFLEGFSTPQGTPPPTVDTTVYQFGLLQKSIGAYVTNPDARGACKWSSIAGYVTKYDGSAVNGYGVHVVGEGVDQTVATGSSTGFGPGGFEVPLGNAARDAQYVAQLIDPQGQPVSPVYTVVTKSDCSQNIAKLIFVENTPS
jgi:hypothetical protein